MEDRLFNTAIGLKMTPEQIVQEMIAYMQADETRKYKIIIGSDSERRSTGSADFVTAIVIHRVGNGGRYFWRRTEAEKKFHTLRDRIWEEVIMSLDVARDFLDTAKKFEMPSYDFEIHVDVGENGATRAIIQELVGMVRANNFEAKTKPDSYAASKVADRHV